MNLSRNTGIILLFPNLLLRYKVVSSTRIHVYPSLGQQDIKVEVVPLYGKYQGESRPLHSLSAENYGRTTHGLIRFREYTRLDPVHVKRLGNLALFPFLTFSHEARILCLGWV